MPRLCTGCGLTTDDDGSLIANVSGGTYEDVYTCGASNGGKVYCSSSDGKLYVDPAPYYREWQFVSEVGADGSAKLTEAPYNVPAQLEDILEREFTGGSFTITNPDPCRTMNLWIEIGIQHALFTVDSGGAAANDDAVGDIQIEAYYTLTSGCPGGPNAAKQPGGHQHWGARAHGDDGKRELYRMDTTGAYFDLPKNANGTSPYKLPAGCSVTVTSIAKLIVIRHQVTGNGAVKLENWRNAIKVRGWSGN